jgi:hypothetical protein
MFLKNIEEQEKKKRETEERKREKVRERKKNEKVKFCGIFGYLLTLESVTPRTPHGYSARPPPFFFELILW